MPVAKRAEQIKSLVRSEILRLLKEDGPCRQTVTEITSGQYAEKERTEDRFDRILNELKADRETRDKKWEENQALWKAEWRENQAKRKEDQALWNARWEENQKVINETLASIKALDRKYEGSIGALGARWGLQSEASFRNGLKADRCIVISPMVDPKAPRAAQKLGVEVYSYVGDVEISS